MRVAAQSRRPTAHAPAALAPGPGGLRPDSPPTRSRRWCCLCRFGGRFEGKAQQWQLPSPNRPDQRGNARRMWLWCGARSRGGRALLLACSGAALPLSLLSLSLFSLALFLSFLSLIPCFFNFACSYFAPVCSVPQQAPQWYRVWRKGIFVQVLIFWSSFKRKYYFIAHSVSQQRDVIV